MTAFNPAGWLKMTTAEQEALVRPYYAAYCARRARLTETGEYPYNESFVGHVGITSETSRADEDTAIYLLQSMFSRDDMRVKVAEAVEEGGVEPSEIPVGKTIRADIAIYGFYAGETGFKKFVDGRFTYYGDQRGFTFIPKGKQHGIVLSSPNVLVVPR